MNENFLWKFVFSFFYVCMMSSLIIASRVHIHPYMWRYSGNFQWRQQKTYRHTCTYDGGKWVNESYIKSFFLLLFFIIILHCKRYGFHNNLGITRHIEICLTAVYAEARIYSFSFLYRIKFLYLHINNASNSDNVFLLMLVEVWWSVMKWIKIGNYE